jgi:ribonuclease D
MLADEVLGVHLDKREQCSDWTSRPLSAEQEAYAGADVRHLHDLQRRLTWKLADEGRTELFDSCMMFLPARVELTLLGLNDVFAYQLADAGHDLV